VPNTVHVADVSVNNREQAWPACRRGRFERPAPRWSPGATVPTTATTTRCSRPLLPALAARRTGHVPHAWSPRAATRAGTGVSHPVQASGPRSPDVRWAARRRPPPTRCWTDRVRPLEEAHDAWPATPRLGRRPTCTSAATPLEVDAGRRRPSRAAPRLLRPALRRDFYQRFSGPSTRRGPLWPRRTTSGPRRRLEGVGPSRGRRMMRALARLHANGRADRRCSSRRTSTLAGERVRATPRPRCRRDIANNPQLAVSPAPAPTEPARAPDRAGALDPTVRLRLGVAVAARGRNPRAHFEAPVRYPAPHRDLRRGRRLCPLQRRQPGGPPATRFVGGRATPSRRPLTKRWSWRRLRHSKTPSQ
jgi:hypothetical protein